MRVHLFSVCLSVIKGENFFTDPEPIKRICLSRFHLNNFKILKVPSIFTNSKSIQSIYVKRCTAVFVKVFYLFKLILKEICCFLNKDQNVCRKLRISLDYTPFYRILVRKGSFKVFILDYLLVCDFIIAYFLCIFNRQSIRN